MKNTVCRLQIQFGSAIIVEVFAWFAYKNWIRFKIHLVVTVSIFGCSLKTTWIIKIDIIFTSRCYVQFVEIKSPIWLRIVDVGIIRNVFKNHGQIAIYLVANALNHWDMLIKTRIRTTGSLVFPQAGAGVHVTK